MTIVNFMLLVGVWWIWVLVANQIAFNQRQQLISCVSMLQAIRIEKDQEISEDLWRVFDAVSYVKHFSYVLTLRNPMKLYPPEIRL